MLFDRNGLGFGLGGDLLRPTLKISADGCCDRLECGGCVVGWGGVEGVVSTCAIGFVLVHFSAWMDLAFLPLGSLLMVAALCGVGENWMVHSLWGHGLDADGG